MLPPATLESAENLPILEAAEAGVLTDSSLWSDANKDAIDVLEAKIIDIEVEEQMGLLFSLTGHAPP